MNSKGKIIFTTIIELIIPIVLFYFAQPNILDKYIQNLWWAGKPIDVIKIQGVCLFLGTIYTILVIGYHIVRIRIDIQQIKSKRGKLIAHNKDTMLDALRIKFTALPHDIEIRIFVPETLLDRISSILQGKPYKAMRFAIRNIEGLADAGTTDELSFEVKPNPEGLVGQCYKLRQIVLDRDLLTSSADYNLDDHKKNKTANLRFCMCVPVIGNNNNVAAIIAFDSKQPAKSNGKEDANWKDNIVIPYTRMLYETIPDIFI
jgi:hypothetical protein